MTIERALELLPQMRDSEWITAVGQVTAIYTDEAKEVFNTAISALEKQEQDRWIPVTERLPEEDCECRVTEGDFKSVFDCNWNNHKKQFEVWSAYEDDYVLVANVIAWKPKEEPYKAEEDNEQS